MKLRLTLLLCFFTAFLQAQTEDEPVLWSQSVNVVSETEYELVLIGKILEGWHVYSQYTDEGGSLPAVFTFMKAGEAYELVGITEESKTQTAYSDIFDVDETFFKKEAVFRQKIKLIDPAVTSVDVELFYQVCKEVCIPVEDSFTFSLKGQAAVPPVSSSVDARSLALSEALRLDLKNKDLLDQTLAGDVKKTNSIWTIFGLGFLGGLIALLTPCVFPMIPLTVSFFTKQSQKTKGTFNALLYAFFIILIYGLLSLPFHLFDSVDSQILNTIATNIWVNLAFFLIFVFFAFSFFGYYELTLPSSWSNRMDKASSRAGGALGIFFMAVTLAIVSFSCTGPILGGLLGSTTLAEGDVANNLSMGMLGFGAALALPFGLFALFPSWLNTLPRSGGWMNTVKVVLGFLELALAFKFLSNADLVGNWGFLKREIFLGIWILLFILTALYLFGFIRFPHEPKGERISITRKIVGVLSVLFVAYLSLGLTNQTSLKALSGFPPPDFYTLSSQSTDCPLGIECYKNFEEGLAVARANNKPILLDFTGWACVNCRKMEENVWSESDIFPMLNEDIVLISLYIDDRKPLPDHQQFKFQYSSGKIKNINTIGEKWGTFQTLNFGSISQPYYVLLSPDLEVLQPAIQNTDADTYREWLSSGIQNFEESETLQAHSGS
ncbi:MAG: thioredoxin family protein [Bacteroidia bacterium]|nr:thioredoxin family protein [Bacteroidia bacterium]